MRSPEDYELVTYRLMQRLRQQNVVHAEVYVSVGVIRWRGQPVEPIFEGAEAPTALLSDSSLACRLLGCPSVSPATMIGWTAEWIRSAQPTLNKPTHFEVADGRF